MEERSEINRALIVSGGGSKGAFGGGVAQYLIEEEEKEYDLLIGTSTGSLLTPFIAIKKMDTLKESVTDNVNFTFTITSFKDEVYVEQYTTSEEITERVKSLFGSSVT